MSSKENNASITQILQHIQSLEIEFSSFLASEAKILHIFILPKKTHRYIYVSTFFIFYH